MSDGPCGVGDDAPFLQRRCALNLDERDGGEDGIGGDESSKFMSALGCLWEIRRLIGRVARGKKLKLNATVSHDPTRNSVYPPCIDPELRTNCKA